MSEQGTSGINRAFSWLKRVLQITEKTVAPDRLDPNVISTLDVFGWERLAGPTEHDNTGAAAPAVAVNGPVTPDDVVRLVLFASVRHTDPGEVHFLWIDKLMPTGGGLIGVTTPNVGVLNTIDQSADRWIILEPGSRLRGRSGNALVAGALAIDINFVDLPVGEYVQL